MPLATLQGKQLWDQIMEVTPEEQAAYNRDHQALPFSVAFENYNQSLGNSLGQLPEQPQDIQGRDHEIQLLYEVMERPRTPVALLLGQAGVGKTATVEELVKELNNGTMKFKTVKDNQYVLLSLRLGRLAAIGNSRLESALAGLLDNLKSFQDWAQAKMHDKRIKFILFIDEVHMLVTIFGPGTKIGGDVLKDTLARAPIRVIAATTKREYDSTIAVDQPLKERFKQIELQELPRHVVMDIAHNWWHKITKDQYPMPADSVIQHIIDANAMYRSDSAEPRKTLDLLEDLVSYESTTGRPAGRQTVDQIFNDRYSIQLDFDMDPDKVYAEIQRRIKGQPYALHMLKRALRAMAFQLDDVSTRPLLTLLFTGPTGVGKSETTKAIADAMYPGEPVLLNINMPDYKTPALEPSFRKRLGEFVRHTPKAIVLLDEVEKADRSVLDSLLAILDEGTVTFETENREGRNEVNSVSLRNTIIIATTNAGHEVFENDTKFNFDDDVSETVMAAQVDRLIKQIQKHLEADGFRSELLGRFDRIIPYRGLTTGALLEITDKKLNELAEKFMKVKGISIKYPNYRQWRIWYNETATDVAIYVAFVKAKADDSNSGGARNIARQLDSTVYDSIVDAAIEHPDARAFAVTVTHDTRVYDPGLDDSQGGIEVHAIASEQRPNAPQAFDFDTL